MDNQNFYRSIFNNVSVEQNFCYIHFPLIYNTSVMLCPQSYADALITFLSKIGLQKCIYNKIIDNLVVELLYSDINQIHNVAIEKFNDTSFFKKQKCALDNICKVLPKYFEIIENSIKNREKISFDCFKKIYKMLVELIAINYFSFIPENFLNQFLNNNQNSQKYLDYISQNTFSHMKYFSEAKNILNSQNEIEPIIDFCWNVGFLEKETIEATNFENVEFVSKLLNKKITRYDLCPKNFKYPSFNTLNDEYDMPLMILWTKLLQINLEIRHYWQFRLFRNLRFYYDNEKNMITNWVIKDYEKNNFEIK